MRSRRQLGASLTRGMLGAGARHVRMVGRCGLVGVFKGTGRQGFVDEIAEGVHDGPR